jgi:uncharacterized protein (DUF4415 family)
VKKNTGIVRYTAAEIEAMRRAGEDLTDKHKTALNASPDDDDAFDWSRAEIGVPQSKQQLTVRFDRDVIDWFRAQGAGYQTRMNAVLRKFVEARRKAG